MTSLRVSLSRLLELVSFRRRETRLAEEVETHLALLRERYEREGLSPEAARFAAQREFGVVSPMVERHRDARGLPWLDTLRLDLRFAWRLLRRDRAFTAAAVLVLALGIGVNNMMFTLLYAHTLRGLPIDRPDRTVFVSTLNERGAAGGFTRAELETLMNGAQTLEHVSAFVTTPATLGDPGRPPDRVEAVWLTAGALALFDVRPAAGRLLTTADDASSAPRVALVTRALWKARYAGDASIIGRTILVDGLPAIVVGVTPDRPALPTTAQVWLPLTDQGDLAVAARLRDGVSLEAARGEVDAMVTRFERPPGSSVRSRGQVVPVNDRYFGRASDPAWRAFAAVGVLVALIACANVANLLLARALDRTREIALRLSLGATRARVVRQLLIESCLLATFGGAAGLAVGVAGVRGFRSFIPENVLPFWLDYTIDGTVLAALVIVSAAAVIVFGVVPALQASKADITPALKDTGGGVVLRRARRWTTLFLTAELALSVLMLANLALGRRVRQPPLPAETRIDRPDILTGAAVLPARPYADESRRLQFARGLVDRLTAAPSIAAASVTSALPLEPGERRVLRLLDRPAADEPPLVSMVAVGPRYFETLGVSLIRGHELDWDAAGLTPDAPAPAIVNERFVERHLSGEPPIGRRLTLSTVGDRAAARPRPLTIVGVAPVIRQSARPDPEPVVFVPFGFAPSLTPHVLVRAHGDPADVPERLRTEAMAVDAAVPVHRVRTLARVIADAQWNGRAAGTMIAALTLISVVLAGAGLSAVTAHAVSQRRREIGVRVALGAGRLHVARLVLARVYRHVLIGFVAGFGFVVLWSRLFPSGRADRTIVDPVVLAMVGAALVVVASLAAIGPLRRALTVDPVRVLRA